MTRRKIHEYIYSRASNSKRVHHPIYILPTVDGLKVVALNLTLLVLGLIYANNYVLLFNFILFCLFLASMFYTHFNLSGLKLTSTQIPALHVKENGQISLHFSSTNSQGHYFIKPYFKSHLIEIAESEKTFAVPFDQKSDVAIPIKGIKRGEENIHSLYVETLFPFGFFRCFTFFKIDQDSIVYPERENLKIHGEIEIVENTSEEGEDFFIREYQIGDSLKRVDWKKLAQTNHWYTRQFQSAKPNPILLVLDKTPTEETLKSICFAMHSLHHQNIKYGLKLKNDVLVVPENSPRHLNQCLRELARYET
jgi:uncharacterized protein (DUF58 family)